MEVCRALLIVMAQTFQSAFRQPTTPDRQRQFDEFAAATGGLAFRLSSSVVPDVELDLISKLYNPTGRGDTQSKDESIDEKMKRMQRRLEFSKEEQRLQSLMMSDAAWSKSETIESFVAFLKTFNCSGDDYWANVYHRIGLALPKDHVRQAPLAQPQPKKGWWDRLFR
jgi:hypothetical protein